MSGFTSQLYPGEVVLSDDTPVSSALIDGGGRGLDLSNRPDVPYAYGAAATPFPPELLVPRHEWQARIQEMEEQKSRLSDLIRMRNLPPKNQSSLPYCWVFAVVHAFEIARLKQNEAMISYSPASVGAQVTGFRKIGGWGKDALDFMIQHGVCRSSVWADVFVPSSSTEQQRMLEAFNREADQNQIIEWMECAPRNLDQQISLLLRRNPYGAGRNVWSHETCDCDPVWLDGAIAIRTRNQWLGWGDFGFGIMQGKYLLSDDSVSPFVAETAGN